MRRRAQGLAHPRGHQVPGIARHHFANKGVHVDLIKLYGSMELAPLDRPGRRHRRPGLHRQARSRPTKLVEVEQIMDISSRLVVNQAALKLKREPIRAIIDAFERRPPGSRFVVTPSALPPDPLATTQPPISRRIRWRVLHWSAEQDAAIEAARGRHPGRREKRGDAAVLEYTQRFDGRPRLACMALELDAGRLQAALAPFPPRSSAAPSKRPAARVRTTTSARRPAGELELPMTDGTLLGQKVTPLDRVGIYVPGGKAAYPSSVLMNAIPAMWPGGRDHHGRAHAARRKNPLVLAAAAVAGVDRAFTIGGAQAVAALAYGTATVPAVDKITGPATPTWPAPRSACSARSAST